MKLINGLNILSALLVSSFAAVSHAGEAMIPENVDASCEAVTGTYVCADATFIVRKSNGVLELVSRPRYDNESILLVDGEVRDGGFGSIAYKYSAGCKNGIITLTQQMTESDTVYSFKISKSSVGIRYETPWNFENCSAQTQVQ